MDIQALEGKDKALFDEIMCIADTKMVLAGWYMITIPNGRAIGDWCAISGMMQDHYGHARALFGYLGRYGLTRAYAEWDRPASAIRGPEMLDSPPESWVDLIVSGFLAEHALIALLGAYEGDACEPELAALATKIVKESRFHLSYFNGWLKVLATSQPESVETFVAGRFRSMMRWWGPRGARDPLADGFGRSTSLEMIRETYVSGLSSSFPAFSLSMEEADFTDWDPSAMRGGAPGIPEKLFELIRFKNVELAMP